MTESTPKSNEQLKNTNYTRSATRKLREKFTPKKEVTCNLDEHKSMLERLYNLGSTTEVNKNAKTAKSTNQNRIK